MTTHSATDNTFLSDEAFDSLYSLRARQLSAIHWTPIKIAKRAAEHLTGGTGKNILDIGSGVGKFCIVGAHEHPTHIFHGVEQRKTLIDEALIAQKATNTCNANFIHANFNELDTDQFDNFYFYNSFSENLFHYKPIDNLVPSSTEIYEDYVQLFNNLLTEKSPGTRLATFYCPDGYIPPSYKRVGYNSGDTLCLWIKR